MIRPNVAVVPNVGTGPARIVLETLTPSGRVTEREITADELIDLAASATAAVAHVRRRGELR